ncbi:Coa1p NDAI_0F00170 [Naumovozyma dairenensis CBS 421]|uniref:Uncharacterized protein n=1 Tax=Naumovozyma dairenensis (strain ATCC 10597 / BCRC 20456 / CBS 421 / NBRC 0211 / NRRL Y-12639) TaxID=1071378 RepID=G0WC25_NAUDC|nr:hypothetical protein NDAI_0F00170 [Naumovozyma dairenensis CBS 421]CCD25336.1 hypothetical protein NDAI_0F00170 [Naumovozyma dairenensis CBS 421]
MIRNQMCRSVLLITGCRCSPLSYTNYRLFSSISTLNATATSAPEAEIILKNKDKPLRIERELPDPREDRRKQIFGFIGFSVAITASLALLFNYEKTESPIISTSLYQLRRSPITTELLGENIEFAGLTPWVFGQLNPVKGKIDIKFYIKGDKGKTGVVKLVADRANRSEEFLIHEWSVTVDDKHIDLLEETPFKVD